MIFVFVSAILMMISTSNSKLIFRSSFFIVYMIFSLTFAYGYDWIFYYQIYQTSDTLTLLPFEPGVFYSMRLFHYLGFSFPVYMFFVSSFIYFCLYRFCISLKNPSFTFFFMFSFFGFFMYVEQIRQGLAISIILLGLSNFNERNKLSIWYPIVACLFHVSAIFFIILNVIYSGNEKKLKKGFWIITIIVFSFIYIFINPSVIKFIPYIGEKIYGYSIVYNSDGTSFYEILLNSRLAVVYLALLILFYFCYKKVRELRLLLSVSSSYFLFLSKLTPFLIRFGYYSVPYIIIGFDSYLIKYRNTKRFSIYIIPITIIIFMVSTIPIWNQNYLTSTKSNLNIFSNSEQIHNEIAMKCNQLRVTGYGTVIMPYCY